MTVFGAIRRIPGLVAGKVRSVINPPPIPGRRIFMGQVAAVGAGLGAGLGLAACGGEWSILEDLRAGVDMTPSGKVITAGDFKASQGNLRVAEVNLVFDGGQVIGGGEVARANIFLQVGTNHQAAGLVAYSGPNGTKGTVVPVTLLEATITDPNNTQNITVLKPNVNLGTISNPLFPPTRVPGSGYLAKALHRTGELEFSLTVRLAYDNKDFSPGATHQMDLRVFARAE
ncbi:hypothetical protein A2291_03765 [candidate division WOR-1 bacterium RIFOXYB2_FULL_42_35]|uniref:Uncharacterized protein n=1 Tax=candidate division WOR-1 bacterium RIFOXYC2_FULL_41_25 TaxID=1802586 RepID=A0A1F4TQN5_UNCSA|nr:MAG: hypothetical protein A2247_00020 [candidate division WOR-1 bacterium RIFOXYA2_FULL_41_14]OGC25579.1 MAG: hypothetical protein A2291_03765 [candidate division WOR-1 bacterium RIFOXYB2_FULL_42_35]OGC35011.1 MAG: hypothetical protein A2462_05395 [candidate division WOR-1 bacterium RIFOXYC2_FULL_41_25]